MLNPEYITEGGHRRYKKQKSEDDRISIGYSRVSSTDQKEDLARQSLIIQQSGVNKIISDIGSGLNFNKKHFSGYSSYDECYNKGDYYKIIESQTKPLENNELETLFSDFSLK